MIRTNPDSVPNSFVPASWIAVAAILMVLAAMDVFTSNQARSSMNGRTVKVTEGTDPDVSGNAVIIKRTDSNQYVVFPVGEISVVIQDLEAIRKRHQS